MNRLEKVDIKRFNKAVHSYVKAQQDRKDSEAAFEHEREVFTKAADIFYELKGDNESYVLQDEISGSIIVSKVQKVNVQWNVSKLCKAVGKQISKAIINKRYEINNMEGLIAYLKECGVDPKVFKSYINVEESVDVKELERLEELGKVSKEQLAGCYSAKCQKPYYQVRKGRKLDGEQ